MNIIKRIQQYWTTQKDHKKPNREIQQTK